MMFNLKSKNIRVTEDRVSYVSPMNGRTILDDTWFRMNERFFRGIESKLIPSTSSYTWIFVYYMVKRIQERIRSIHARRIQRQWRESISNPNYALCKKRLMNEASGLIQEVQMDQIWSQLPRELVYKICNYLPQLRSIPPELKMNIEFQEFKLANYYRASRPLFRENTWIHIFNSLSAFVRDRSLFPIDQEWDPKNESYYLWYRLTPELRDEFLMFEEDPSEPNDEGL